MRVKMNGIANRNTQYTFMQNKYARLLGRITMPILLVPCGIGKSDWLGGKQQTGVRETFNIYIKNNSI